MAIIDALGSVTCDENCVSAADISGKYCPLITISPPCALLNNWYIDVVYEANSYPDLCLRVGLESELRHYSLHNSRGRVDDSLYLVGLTKLLKPP